MPRTGAARDAGWRARGTIPEMAVRKGAISPLWRVRRKFDRKDDWKVIFKLYYSVQLRQVKLPELALINKNYIR
ncbi:hypothetical protein ACFMBG_15155 [Leisingera sp. D0M16]|uniref:hypothetical protein n=1 Tax=Leisingera coralii TaxID=3351347 RepID=UPI003B81E30E